MHKFVRSLITEWRKVGLPVEGGTIVVAVSGGADSMSLLLAINELTKRKKLQLRVIVAHLNHNLRGRESNEDEEFVADFALVWGLEYVSANAKVKGTGNLEQNARDARYKFLSKTAKDLKAFAVLTGHTQNDQAETFLLNLVRGSGADGLAAMDAVRELDRGILLVRPLLAWATREDTEHFCRENGVKYRSDRMNDDDAFTRVKIRKSVIPLLAGLNPQIVKTLARTAELVGREKGRKGEGEKGRKGEREKGRKGEREKGRKGEGELKLAELKSLAKSELYETLRGWLRESRGDLRGLQLKHIEAIGRLIHSQKSGKVVEIPGRGRVVKTGGRLSFER